METPERMKARHAREREALAARHQREREEASDRPVVMLDPRWEQVHALRPVQERVNASVERQAAIRRGW